jgi:hypothetical protein
VLTKRDFLGDETWRAWKQDEERMLQFRNEVAAKKGKPSEEDLFNINLNKPWLAFYKKILYDPPKKK